MRYNEFKKQAADEEQPSFLERVKRALGLTKITPQPVDKSGLHSLELTPKRISGSYEPGRGFIPDSHRVTITGSYEPGRYRPFVADTDRATVSGTYDPGMGFFPDSADRAQTQVYTSTSQMPKGKRIAVLNHAGNTTKRFDAQYMKGYWANFNTPEKVGATPFRIQSDANSTRPPIVTYTFPAPGSYNVDAPNSRSYTINPAELANYEAGMKMYEPSYRAFLNANDRRLPTNTYGFNPHSRTPLPAPTREEMEKAINSGRVSFTKMPGSNAEQWAILTGDPNHLDSYEKYLESLPKEVHDRAGISLSSPQEREAWKKYTNPLLTFFGSTSYVPTYGTIHMPERELENEYNRHWGRYNNYHWHTLPSTANGYYASGSRQGNIASSLSHEANHAALEGRYRFDPIVAARTLFQPDVPTRWVSNDPWVPGWRDMGHASLMKQKHIDPMYQTEKQFGWSGDHAIEPYAITPSEITQAFVNFNKERSLVKNHMQQNPNNSNYAQLEPEVKQAFLDLPDHIGYGFKGKDQLDKMMNLFIEHPELQLLMPEGARLVGYYQNLKAAIDTAKTPEERFYFYNLMDKMIYDRSYLANAQGRPNVSYPDVQRMRA